jgi:hypothetical protein
MSTVTGWGLLPTDALAAAVCATVKHRGERFESDDQLTSRLDDDEVHYTPDSLSAALQKLEAAAG